MQTKADVQAAVEAYMRARGLKHLTELADVSKVPYATLGRMMSRSPTYQGKPQEWARLADCIGADPLVVLAAVGLAPPADKAPRDPELGLRRALYAYGVPANEVEDFMRYAEGRRALAQIRAAKTD